MTRGLLLVADGYSTTHLEYAYHRLREDAVLVDVAAPGGGTARSDRGGGRDAVPVDGLPAERRYDLVVIPGGRSPEGLAADGSTRRWLEEHLDGGGVTCAVAGGVRVLLELGALDGRTATGPPALRDELAAAGAIPTAESVTVDGTIVTVRDTDALPFGVAAALASVAIPQDPATLARERPNWGGPERT